MSPFVVLLARHLTIVNPCENMQINVRNPLDLFLTFLYNNLVRVEKHT
ncbi:hypothetical protein [Synechococcus phage S-E7]|nr:hypothetical protein [Synechococcus phage S-E7]